mmetsp:Transcript_6374/g.18833  ORF Transcript_6374/g.18833 Transcript_6374/m.18833 type:complete len:305 (+) Transcript_6374:267-1181(+)
MARSACAWRLISTCCSVSNSSAVSFSSSWVACCCSSSRISAQVLPSPFRESSWRPWPSSPGTPCPPRSGEEGLNSWSLAELMNSERFGGRLEARYALRSVTLPSPSPSPLTLFRSAIQLFRPGDAERCLLGDSARLFDRRSPSGCNCATVARQDAVRGESPACTTPSGARSSLFGLFGLPKRRANQLSSSGSSLFSPATTPFCRSAQPAAVAACTRCCEACVTSCADRWPPMLHNLAHNTLPASYKKLMLCTPLISVSFARGRCVHSSGARSIMVASARAWGGATPHHSRRSIRADAWHPTSIS